MLADTEVVRDRINRIRKYVRELRVFSEISLESFRQNTERQYAVLHALQMAIEACIEIGTHICAADSLGVPSSYAETFQFLEHGGCLTADLASDLRAMARFRNRIVHFYWEMDPDQVYLILRDRLGDFDRYAKAIEEYLPPGNSG
ncbi:MAG: type VII toxin-antitoxin system HepT family RNase toxin [Planctomycetota bacterium]|jgi:uncharacterized protein YutE (UPF0331/DUF86 family)